MSDITAAVSSALNRDKRQIETGLDARITYALVESDHPYKPASVAIYNVTLWLYIVVLLCEQILDENIVSVNDVIFILLQVRFVESVRWMSVEFDTRCSTVQEEDSLTFYTTSTSDDGIVTYTKLHTFSRDSWPRRSIVIPGQFLKACSFAISYCVRERCETQSSS